MLLVSAGSDEPLPDFSVVIATGITLVIQHGLMVRITQSDSPVLDLGRASTTGHTPGIGSILGSLLLIAGVFLIVRERI